MVAATATAASTTGATPREQLEAVLAEPATWRTAMVLETLRPQLARMGADERMLYAAAWDRQSSAATANGMLAQVAATEPQPGPAREIERGLLVDELALMLRRSERSVSCQLHTARWLTATAPTLFTLLQRGDASVGHALAFAELTGNLEPVGARRVDKLVSARAETATVAAFRRLVRQAVAEVDPDPGPRHEKAKRNAGVALYPGEDGMATIELYLAATDAVASMNAINTAADAAKTDGDDRTHGMRQVDAFLEAVLGGGAAAPATPPETGEPPARRRTRRTEVRVTIDLLTLLRLGESPAELEGYGPIPAELARQLAAESTSVLRRLVTDPISGMLLDYGRTRYTADAVLRGLLEARDVTCRWPGCLRPAWRCDVEHCTPYDSHGATSTANCSQMCVKHHTRKTHDGFSYRRTDPATGETVWVTALGFSYRQAAAAYRRSGIDTGDTIRIVDDPDPPPP